MGIRCAGEYTLLPDAEGELQTFLNRYLSEQGMSFFFDMPERDDVRIVTPTKSGADGIVIPIPRPNWKFPTTPKLNTLYWPTGASRWAYCLLLADDDAKDAIANAGDSSNEAEPVVLEFFTGDIEEAASSGYSNVDENVGVAVEMHVLYPHPISVTTGENETNLWIIPLVDERYHWQWKNVGAIGDEEIPDWETLITTIADFLGGAANTLEVPSDFDWMPDVEGKSSLNYANAAVLLDAAAQSVGLRVVRQFSGDLEILSPDSAITNWDNSYTAATDDTLKQWSRLAGGEFQDPLSAATLPETIEVLFQTDGTLESVNITDQGGVKYTPGTSKLIRVPYVPDDFEDQTTLAEKIAFYFIGWQGRHGDITFAGVKAWDFGGIEDFLEIELGAFGRNGDPWSAQTRVKSLPSNFGITSLLSSGEVSGGCQPQFVLWIHGSPSGGSITLPVTVSTSGGDVTENVVIAYDAGTVAPGGFGGGSEEYINTAFATHSEITVNDIVVTSPGGSLPNQVIRFYFTNDVSTDDVTIGNDTNNLTGGWRPYATLDTCCGE